MAKEEAEESWGSWAVLPPSWSSARTQSWRGGSVAVKADGGWLQCLKIALHGKEGVDGEPGKEC